jgi:hypothetical protein
MQCTAQALNFACANRVIILDVWWNYAMEQQAFGHVYRMGQKKETHFGRIMVRNTIDIRLANLQRDKLKTISKEIKDHDSSDLTLTEEDLASLLGRVVRDAEGNIINIEADYDDENDQEAGEAAWANYTFASDGLNGEWEQETSLETEATHEAVHENTVENAHQNTLENNLENNFENFVANSLTNFLENANENF